MVLSLVLFVALSLERDGPQRKRTAADLSPNNRGFAMAEADKGPNDRVSFLPGHVTSAN
jgi:hypothetical protein